MTKKDYIKIAGILKDRLDGFENYAIKETPDWYIGYKEAISDLAQDLTIVFGIKL